MTPASGATPIDPDPGMTRMPFAGDSAGAKRNNQRFLDRSQIPPVQVPPVTFEIDDRIPDQLPGPVIRDITATFDLEQLYPARLEQRWRRHKGSILAGPA